MLCCACVCRFLWLADEMSVFVSPSGILYEERCVRAKKRCVFFFDHLVFDFSPFNYVRVVCVVVFYLTAAAYELKTGFFGALLEGKFEGNSGNVFAV
jgi:hypothetical protein